MQDNNLQTEDEKEKLKKKRDWSILRKYTVFAIAPILLIFLGVVLGVVFLAEILLGLRGKKYDNSKKYSFDTSDGK